MFDAVRCPSSLTMVLTALIARAESSTLSTSAITSCLKGIDTEQPRMPSARTPPIAAAMSVVVNAFGRRFFDADDSDTDADPPEPELEPEPLPEFEPLSEPEPELEPEPLAESEPLPLREDSEPLLDCEPERELPEPETLERPPSDSSLLSLAFDVAMAKKQIRRRRS